MLPTGNQTVSIRDVLLYILPDSGRGNDATVAFAAGLAGQFQARVTGVTFALQTEPPVSLYAPVIDEAAVERERNANRARAEAALAGAEQVFARAGRPFLGIAQPAFPGDVASFLIEFARVRDIAVLPNRTEKNSGESELIEEVMFGSGRPLLLVPDAGRTAFGTDNVMVAWDGSRAAARAVGDAMPILAAAKAVHVITVGDEKDMDWRLQVDEFLRHLEQCGVKARARNVSCAGLDIGRALFREAAAADADLLVMGGYGHSRVREFILGGATRSVIEGAPLPILMSH